MRLEEAARQLLDVRDWAALRSALTRRQQVCWLTSILPLLFLITTSGAITHASTYRVHYKFRGGVKTFVPRACKRPV